MSGILNGIRVYDLGRIQVAPYCAMLLGDLGAEVIKVEEPTIGDGQRTLPPFVQGQSYPFMLANRNKKSITLNLKTNEGKEIFKKLISKGNVIVENYSAGTMEKLGLGYNELQKTNPELIYMAISGFGQTGPYRSYPAIDPVVQAMSGVMSMTGFPDGPPMPVGMLAGDYIGSIYGVMGVLGAVISWKDTGKGQFIDISMQDCLWAGCGTLHMVNYLTKGELPRRSGTRSRTFAPMNNYIAKDGYVNIGINYNKWWDELLRIMGKEELIGDERFSRQSARIRNIDEVDAMVESWTKERTQEEIVTKLRSAGIACGPVLNIEDLLDDPHLQHREMVLETSHPVEGKIKTVGHVLKYSETPCEIKLPPPLLGEHNEKIYGELLGYNAEKLATLKQQGII